MFDEITKDSIRKPEDSFGFFMWCCWLLLGRVEEELHCPHCLIALLCKSQRLRCRANIDNNYRSLIPNKTREMITPPFTSVSQSRANNCLPPNADVCILHCSSSMGSSTLSTKKGPKMTVEFKLS